MEDIGVRKTSPEFREAVANVAAMAEEEEKLRPEGEALWQGIGACVEREEARLADIEERKAAKGREVMESAKAAQAAADAADDEGGEDDEDDED